MWSCEVVCRCDYGSHDLALALSYDMDTFNYPTATPVLGRGAEGSRNSILGRLAQAFSFALAVRWDLGHERADQGLIWSEALLTYLSDHVEDHVLCTTYLHEDTFKICKAVVLY